MSRRKEPTMGIEAVEHARRDPGGRRWPRLAAAVSALAAALAAAPAEAERSSVVQHGPPPELQRARSKRWWTDPWGHSMQEQAFMSWMNEATGGVEWMYLMPTQQVYAAYAWWLEFVWPGGDHPK